MSKLVRSLMVGLLVCLAVGCSKTPQEKANDAVEQYNSIVDTMNRTGFPTCAWTTAQIDAYEVNLQHLLALQKKVDDLKNKDGVVIRGADNSKFYYLAKSRIKLVRVAKSLGKDGKCISGKILKKDESKTDETATDPYELFDPAGTDNKN